MLYQWIGLPSNNHVVNETAPKVNCFAGFCHCRLVTMSAHTHAHCYSLSESGIKTGLWTITLCRKILVLSYCFMNTKNNSKVGMIFYILEAMASVYYSLWGSDNWFCTEYFWLRLLHYLLLCVIALFCAIYLLYCRATVCSIRYNILTGRKLGCFSSD